MCLENSAFVFAVNWKMAITSQFSDMMSSSTFLTLLCFSCQVQLLNKFHVNIITGSGVMTVSFYRGMTRGPEIEDTPSEFCLINSDWVE